MPWRQPPHTRQALGRRRRADALHFSQHFNHFRCVGVLDFPHFTVKGFPSMSRLVWIIFVPLASQNSARRLAKATASNLVSDDAYASARAVRSLNGGVLGSVRILFAPERRKTGEVLETTCPVRTLVGRKPNCCTLCAGDGMSPSVLLLVLYPVIGMAAPLVFYSLWPKKHLPVPNLAADAVTQTDMVGLPLSALTIWVL
jgi:hypothetical protein